MSKIKILKLTSGVFWVEIESADLRILCSSPADSVKHIMKNSLMQSTFENGYFIETGPNAILLSDVIIQNGAFSNLCEFPVLQMLYRQGLLIPTHPNNTGQKPLLIGSQEQISLQLDYIFRGNYGLISPEEIMECNISKELADDLMNMKLKFAFGKINSSNGLLDSVIVKNKKTEIKDGVFIQRVSFNRFSISYEGESCEVDLNLSPSENYEPPYSLGFHNLNRENFAVIHSGEGDGWDVHRSTMSSVLMHDGKVYLIDAGPNLENILNSLGIGINEVEGIFHTHSHDDHFSGLTTLLKANKKIKYYATSLVRFSVSKKLGALLGIQEEEFSRYFDVQDLIYDEYNKIGSLEVMPILSPHPVETNIFYFRKKHNDTYKSYAHYADITSFKVLTSMIAQEGEIGITQERYDKTVDEYLKYADIKKVDVGGGMIHGEVDDFKEDTSDKIIFAHTSKPIEKDDNSIGHSASFGNIDILIDDNKEYDYLLASDYLDNYFENLEQESMNTFLDCAIKTFMPNEILLNEGVSPNFVYLIISGNVKVTTKENNQITNLSSGAFVAGINVLEKSSTSSIYEAKSYVRALEIPASVFRQVADKYTQLENLHQLQIFLSSTWLFGESAIHSVLKNLYENITQVNIKAGDIIHNNIQEGNIYIVNKGKVKYTLNDLELEVIDKGNFFGENFVFKKPQILTISSVDDSTLYKIPIEAIKNIPSLQWKIYETYTKRFTNIVNKLPKNNEYKELDETNKSDINQIDKLHQTLLDSFNILLFANEGDIKQEIYDALEVVFVNAKYHFQVEESLLIQYNHPNFREHRKEHKTFLKLLKELLEKADNNEDINISEVSNWIDSHFIKDKEMASYLLSKGIF
ncbi:cyclic nucleotide-binding domain-containing protein [Sulfurimonas sp.]